MSYLYWFWETISVVPQLFLEEQNFSLREAQRTLGQRVRLYLLRFILNVIVLFLLGGAFYLIHYAIKTSQNEVRHWTSIFLLDWVPGFGEEIDPVGCFFQSTHKYHWMVSLFLQYLPPITITLVNLFLPNAFRKISSFEDYSFTTQVNATLVR